MENIDAPVSPVTVLVGNNDCGKSNILRALNLFFNGMTNFNTQFQFDEDYNFFASERKRKAKEIVVRLELKVPRTYRKTNGDLIIWEKRWRKEGLTSGEADYHGIKLTKNRLNKEVRKTIDIPGKSNIHALLRKIEFEYVPAIKDATYFDNLRGRIYSIISEVATRTFRTSSTAFEASIGEHLKDLTKNIGSALDLETKLALPRDLSHIFERLDFLSGEQSVSLENRGDGIKARHIPLILKFMAQKKISLQTKGSMPPSFIWAYEEPENNLEFSSAVKLADELVGYTEEGLVQILLTTHSPAFYDLAKNDDSIILHHVLRQSGSSGTKISKNNKEIDEKLGVLAMLAPRVSDVAEQVREQEKAKSEALKLANEKLSIVFVEGESDSLILKRALKIFYPDHVEEIKFETKRQGAGHTYVIDMLNGWRSHHKHHPDRPKVVGVLDGDASTEKSTFNSANGVTKSAKCFCYPIPKHLHKMLGLGFNIPVDLESLYPLAIWEWAKKKNYLEKRIKKDVYPDNLINKILDSQPIQPESLGDQDSLYVKYKFVGNNGSKIKCARYLINKNEDDCRNILSSFKPLLKAILEYLDIIKPATL